MVRPMWAVAVDADRVGSHRSWSPLEISGAAVRIAAIKPAESGNGIVVRLVESEGVGGEVRICWTMPVSSVTPVDLLERPLEREGFEHAAETVLRMGAFEIVTLAIEHRS